MTTAFSPSVLTGSWFPSGYYGHFRNIPRNDFYGEYRQLAKPIPPKIFMRRLKEKPTNHVFSLHDNKYSYMNDATFLDMGVGKKGRPGNVRTFQSQPELLSWQHAPCTLSMYATQFSAGKEQVQKLVTSRGFIPTATQEPGNAHDRQMTSYRYSYDYPKGFKHSKMTPARFHAGRVTANEHCSSGGVGGGGGGGQKPHLIEVSLSTNTQQSPTRRCHTVTGEAALASGKHRRSVSNLAGYTRTESAAECMQWLDAEAVRKQEKDLRQSPKRHIVPESTSLTNFQSSSAVAETNEPRLSAANESVE